MAVVAAPTPPVSIRNDALYSEVVAKEAASRALANLSSRHPGGAISRDEYEAEVAAELMRMGIVQTTRPVVYVQRVPPPVQAPVYQAPPQVQRMYMPVQVYQPVVERQVPGPPRVEYVDKIIYQVEEVEPPPPPPPVTVKQTVERKVNEFPYQDPVYGTSWRFQVPDSLDEQLLGMDLGKHKPTPFEHMRHAAFMKMMEEQWKQRQNALKTGGAGDGSGSYLSGTGAAEGSGSYWGPRRVQEPPRPQVTRVHEDIVL